MKTIHTSVAVVVSKPGHWGDDTTLDREFTTEIDLDVMLSLNGKDKTVTIRDEDQKLTTYKVLNREYHSDDEAAYLVVQEVKSHKDFLSDLFASGDDF